MLFGLEVVELVDQTLKLGEGVAALLGSDALIDREGHSLDGGAHLADGILKGWGGAPVRFDEYGAQFSGDTLGGAGLMEEGQQFLLALLLVCEPDLWGIGEREAPFADLRLLVFGQGPQPVFEPIDGGFGPLPEPLWRRGLYEAGSFVVILSQGFFERAHLVGIDGGEQGTAVGDDPLVEVCTQAIVGGIDPVDILARQSLFESLPDLYEECFILRNGFVPVPCEQRLEPQGEIVALVRSEIEVVIDLPKDDPVGIAIGEGE